MKTDETKAGCENACFGSLDLKPPVLESPNLPLVNAFLESLVLQNNPFSRFRAVWITRGLDEACPRTVASADAR